MIHHTCRQGSDEWLRLRMGRPTASEFDRIITAKKWDLAAGRHSYALRLVTELILGQPLDNVTTAAMQHGKDWEPKAVAAYEFQMGVDTEVCGFCTTDDQLAGASPDRFVGADGSLEVKSPEKPEIHVGYLLNPQTLVDEYFVQVQGQLFITGRKWTDLISYFSGLPMVCVRVTPNPEFQEKLGVNLKLFIDELGHRVSIARDRGWLPEREPEPDHSADFVTDNDVEMILAAHRGQEGLKDAGTQT